MSETCYQHALNMPDINCCLYCRIQELEQQLSDANDFSNKGIEVVHNQRVTIDRLEAQLELKVIKATDEHCADYIAELEQQNAKLVEALKEIEQYAMYNSRIWHIAAAALKEMEVGREFT